MAKVQELDYALLKDLISTDGLYILGYSWLFGMCRWLLHGLTLSSECNVVQRSGLAFLEVGWFLEPFILTDH